MIPDEGLDGLLAVMRHHNVSRNQAFDTDWISDMSDEQMQEVVITLHTYGYIIYKKVVRDYHVAYLCRLTPEGMKFCQEGGFQELAAKKKRRKINVIGGVIAAIASFATIGAFIWKLLSI